MRNSADNARHLAWLLAIGPFTTEQRSLVGSEHASIYTVMGPPSPRGV